MNPDEERAERFRDVQSHVRAARPMVTVTGATCSNCRRRARAVANSDGSMERVFPFNFPRDEPRNWGNFPHPPTDECSGKYQHLFEMAPMERDG